MIEAKTYLLEDIEYIPSPNCDEFPDLQAVDLLVIHCISLPPGNYAGDNVAKLFTNNLDSNEHSYYRKILPLKVSAHLFIRRDGSMIQFVPFNKRAWHAGISEFQGQEACNNFSIGIELEGTEGDPFTEEQYEQIALATRELCKIYPGITRDRIVGHSDIAPKRKNDPGEAFNWQKYFALLE